MSMKMKKLLSSLELFIKRKEKRNFEKSKTSPSNACDIIRNLFFLLHKNREEVEKEGNTFAGNLKKYIFFFFLIIIIYNM